MAELSTRQARRLTLARAGLLRPERTGLPTRASGHGVRARRAANAIVSRFGYLQLDTIAVTGARSHTHVLLSRLDRFEPSLGEALLRPGEPLFEYWGHEASWIPLDLYPAFEFRRRDFAAHPWWGDVLGEHPDVADRLIRRIADEGPLRSVDFEGSSGSEMWDIKVSKKVASAFWSRGDLAIRERRNFQRVFDLAERVIPDDLRDRPLQADEGIRTLLLRALAGFGWAQTGTLAATWRLRNLGPQIKQALAELESSGDIVPCAVRGVDGKRYLGWARPEDVELAGQLDAVRPRRDRGVLLSPFDPLLWDRARTARLFGFEYVVEIFKPAAQRVHGYYSMPVLAGDRLIARVDLKADRKAGTLKRRALHFESDRSSAAESDATDAAVTRLAESLDLRVV